MSSTQYVPCYSEFEYASQLHSVENAECRAARCSTDETASSKRWSEDHGHVTGGPAAAATAAFVAVSLIDAGADLVRYATLSKGAHEQWKKFNQRCGFLINQLESDVENIENVFNSITKDETICTSSAANYYRNSDSNQCTTCCKLFFIRKETNYMQLEYLGFNDSTNNSRFQLKDKAISSFQNSSKFAIQKFHLDLEIENPGKSIHADDSPPANFSASFPKNKRSRPSFFAHQHFQTRRKKAPNSREHLGNAPKAQDHNKSSLSRVEPRRNSIYIVPQKTLGKNKATPNNSEQILVIIDETEEEKRYDHVTLSTSIKPIDQKQGKLPELRTKNLQDSSALVMVSREKSDKRSSIHSFRTTHDFLSSDEATCLSTAEGKSEIKAITLKGIIVSLVARVLDYFAGKRAENDEHNKSIYLNIADDFNEVKNESRRKNISKIFVDKRNVMNCTKLNNRQISYNEFSKSLISLNKLNVFNISLNNIRKNAINLHRFLHIKSNLNEKNYFSKKSKNSPALLNTNLSSTINNTHKSRLLLSLDKKSRLKSRRIKKNRKTQRAHSANKKNREFGSRSARKAWNRNNYRTKASHRFSKKSVQDSIFANPAKSSDVAAPSRSVNEDIESSALSSSSVKNAAGIPFSAGNDADYRREIDRQIEEDFGKITETLRAEKIAAAKEAGKLEDSRGAGAGAGAGVGAADVILKGTTRWSSSAAKNNRQPVSREFQGTPRLLLDNFMNRVEGKRKIDTGEPEIITISRDCCGARGSSSQQTIRDPSVRKSGDFDERKVNSAAGIVPRSESNLIIGKQRVTVMSKEKEIRESRSEETKLANDRKKLVAEALIISSPVDGRKLPLSWILLPISNQSMKVHYFLDPTLSNAALQDKVGLGDETHAIGESEKYRRSLCTNCPWYSKQNNEKFRYIENEGMRLEEELKELRRMNIQQLQNSPRVARNRMRFMDGSEYNDAGNVPSSGNDQYSQANKRTPHFSEINKSEKFNNVRNSEDSFYNLKSDAKKSSFNAENVARKKNDIEEKNEKEKTINIDNNHVHRKNSLDKSNSLQILNNQPKNAIKINIKPNKLIKGSNNIPLSVKTNKNLVSMDYTKNYLVADKSNGKHKKQRCFEGRKSISNKKAIKRRKKSMKTAKEKQLQTNCKERSEGKIRSSHDVAIEMCKSPSTSVNQNLPSTHTNDLQDKVKIENKIIYKQNVDSVKTSNVRRAYITKRSNEDSNEASSAYYYDYYDYESPENSIDQLEENNAAKTIQIGRKLLSFNSIEYDEGSPIFSDEESRYDYDEKFYGDQRYEKAEDRLHHFAIELKNISLPEIAKVTGHNSRVNLAQYGLSKSTIASPASIQSPCNENHSNRLSENRNSAGVRYLKRNLKSFSVEERAKHNKDSLKHVYIEGDITGYDYEEMQDKNNARYEGDDNNEENSNVEKSSNERVYEISVNGKLHLHLRDFDYSNLRKKRCYRSKKARRRKNIAKFKRKCRNSSHSHRIRHNIKESTASAKKNNTSKFQNQLQKITNFFKNKFDAGGHGKSSEGDKGGNSGKGSKDGKGPACGKCGKKEGLQKIVANVKIIKISPEKPSDHREDEEEDSKNEGKSSSVPSVVDQATSQSPDSWQENDDGNTQENDDGNTQENDDGNTQENDDGNTQENDDGNTQENVTDEQPTTRECCPCDGKSRETTPGENESDFTSIVVDTYQPENEILYTTAAYSPSSTETSDHNDNGNESETTVENVDNHTTEAEQTSSSSAEMSSVTGAATTQQYTNSDESENNYSSTMNDSPNEIELPANTESQTVTNLINTSPQTERTTIQANNDETSDINDNDGVTDETNQDSKGQNVKEIMNFIKKVEKMIGDGKMPLKISDKNGGVEIKLEKIFTRPDQRQFIQELKDGSERVQTNDLPIKTAASGAIHQKDNGYDGPADSFSEGKKNSENFDSQRVSDNEDLDLVKNDDSGKYFSTNTNNKRGKVQAEAAEPENVETSDKARESFSSNYAIRKHKERDADEILETYLESPLAGKGESGAKAILGKQKLYEQRITAGDQSSLRDEESTFDRRTARRKKSSSRRKKKKKKRRKHKKKQGNRTRIASKKGKQYEFHRRQRRRRRRRRLLSVAGPRK